MHEILRNFWNQNKDKAIEFTWLDGRSFSEAFVICLGAGPWKFTRRRNVQKIALEKLNNRDLMDIQPNEIFYPLAWQNDYLQRTIWNLKNSLVKSFEEFCQKTPEQITELTGKKSKVISLFCRDFLKIPSFPIDRHVKRKLLELGLPTNEDKMIRICRENDLDPRLVAVIFVRTASSMDNPDWSLSESN